MIDVEGISIYIQARLLGAVSRPITTVYMLVCVSLRIYTYHYCPRRDATPAASQRRYSTSTRDFISLSCTMAAAAAAAHCDRTVSERAHRCVPAERNGRILLRLGADGQTDRLTVEHHWRV